MELPDQLIEMLEEYRLAKQRQEHAQRDYAAANTAFVQSPGDATRDALDTRMDGLTHAARTVAAKAEALTAALALWQRR